MTSLRRPDFEQIWSEPVRGRLWAATIEIVTPDAPDEGFDRRRLIGAGLGVVGGAAALSALAQPAEATANDAQFWSIGPSRIVDSRTGTGTTAGKIRSGQSRTILLGGTFNPGFQLTAILNLTVTGTERAGYLTVWESGRTRPGTSSINWWGANQSYGNLAVVGLRSTPVSFDVYCGGANSATHLLVDVVGYFYDDGTAKVRPPAEKRPPG